MARPTNNPRTPFLTAIRDAFVDRSHDGYLIVERILHTAFENAGYSAPLVAAALNGPMLIPLHVVEANEAHKAKLAEAAEAKRKRIMPVDDYGDGWDWENDRPIYP